MAQRSYPAQRPAAALAPGEASGGSARTRRSVRQRQPPVCSWRRAFDETPRRVGEEAAFDVAALVPWRSDRRRPAFSSLVRAFCYETFPEMPWFLLPERSARR